MPNHRHTPLCERMHKTIEFWLVEEPESDGWNYRRDHKEARTAIEELHAENEKLREANGILEDALQEVGDDYPGSSCQKWCVQQVKAARKALEAPSHD